MSRHKLRTDRQLNFELKEYETLRVEIISKGNHRLQLISIMSSIHLIGFGYAVKSNMGDLLFFLPLFTLPIYFFYIYEYLEEGVMRKYIKQEIEKLECCGRAGWEDYWYNAKCVKGKYRDYLKMNAWAYTQLPIWWMAGISFVPPFVLFMFIIHMQFFSGPKITVIFPFGVYCALVIFYIGILIYVYKFVKCLMALLFTDIGFKTSKIINLFKFKRMM